jgi:ABC-type dipeptide/oligopeptide/nickel transport system ATPase subunit
MGSCLRSQGHEVRVDQTVVAQVSNAIDELGRRPVFLAIDGRSGSVKSTLAGVMVERRDQSSTAFRCSLGSTSLANRLRASSRRSRVSLSPTFVPGLDRFDRAFG